MRGGARPRPKLSDRDHPGAYRIEFRITKRGPEMRLVERARVESPLPYVAGGTLAGVPIRRIAPVGVLQSLRQGLGGAWNGDQVGVVGHQAVTQEGKLVQLGILAEQLQIGEAVGVVGQDDLPSVAALRNMVRNVNDNDARESSHG